MPTHAGIFWMELGDVDAPHVLGAPHQSKSAKSQRQESAPRVNHPKRAVMSIKNKAGLGLSSALRLYGGSATGLPSDGYE